ncbi:MAG: hypothetical protein ACYC9O_14755 [Candidatus Latescibacterota bacterium]
MSDSTFFRYAGHPLEYGIGRLNTHVLVKLHNHFRHTLQQAPGFLDLVGLLFAGFEERFIPQVTFCQIYPEI